MLGHAKVFASMQQPSPCFLHLSSHSYCRIRHFTVMQQMSFIEIYNEQLLDLLQRSSPAREFRERFTTCTRSAGSNSRSRSASQFVKRPTTTTCFSPPLHVGGVSKGESSNHHGVARRACSSNTRTSSSAASCDTPDLVIYERPDGSTYVKVVLTVLRVHALGFAFLREEVYVSYPCIFARPSGFRPVGGDACCLAK